MVFIKYGLSLFDFMQSNAFIPFPLEQVKILATQLLRSICFLHDLNIIHTDLKPENILLVDSSFMFINKSKVLNSLQIKLIDFGSAIFNKDYHPSVISTRQYRSPEVILGMGWSFLTDLVLFINQSGHLGVSWLKCIQEIHYFTHTTI